MMEERPGLNFQADGPKETTGASRPVHEQIGEGIVSNARLVERGRGTDFILELHPPELGKVHVVLQSTQEGLTARLLVADEGARLLVESQLSQLRQRLNESACPVVRCSVGDMGGQSHSRQQHQGWQQPQSPSGGWRLPAVVDISPAAGGERDRLDVVA